MDIKTLNQQFSHNQQIFFINAKSDFIDIQVKTKKASAIISLQGGQVLSYHPAGQSEDLFFLSDKAHYHSTKAIKGGAPICWPWFAANSENADLPFNGFVRNQVWQVKQTAINDLGEAVIILSFTDSPATQKIWPYQFELLQTITIGDSLTIELASHNLGTKPFKLTQAIHSYFKIGDINAVSIEGLDQCAYLDKVNDFQSTQQHGSITIAGEVDRIYTQVNKPLVINDTNLQRRILINYKGSETAVVWNPWIEIAKSSADLADDDYLHFVCVETANAANEIIDVEAGTSYVMSACYQLEKC